MNKTRKFNRILDKFFVCLGFKKLFFTLNNSKKMIKCPILVYHNLSPNIQGVPMELFERHLKFLTKHYVTCTVNEIIKKIKENNIVGNEIVITFDDGFEDNATKVLKLLKKYNAKSTFFISTGFIGKKYLGQKMVNKKQIIDLYNAGMEIGSHTVNHINLNKSSKKERIKELKISKEILEDIIGDQVLSFSYPYGSYNSSVAKDCEKVGYLSASTIFHDFFIKNFFLLPRLIIFPYDHPHDLQSKIEGNRHWLNIIHKVYLQKKLKKHVPKKLS